MTQLPAWVLKIQAAWLALGIFLTVLASQSGIQIPGFLTGLFTQGTWDVIVQAGSALFTAFQVIRSIFVAAPKTSGVGVLAEGKVKAFAYNPFKVSA